MIGPDTNSPFKSDLLDIAGAAEHTGHSVPQMRRLAKRGVFRQIRIGRLLRFSLRQLNEDYARLLASAVIPSEEPTHPDPTRRSAGRPRNSERRAAR